LFADKAIQREAFSFMNRNPNLQNVSQYVTNFGDSYQGLVLLAFGAYGVIFKSNKVKTTALLATQSYIVSAAMSSLVKFCVGRVRPHSFSENPNNLVFEGPNRDGFGSSFPSGHATAAFSAATVFAQQYKDQTLIPVIAYSAATIIALSRISENAHWATDVFAGAALGYVTGKQVVNNYHRYARLKNGKAKTSLLFNLQYCEGVIMPGLVYKF
jgi:membrane-associated phospholipid phosphatase